MTGQSVQQVSPPLMTTPSARAEGTVLLAGDLRILGFSPELPARLGRAPSALWGASISLLLPALAAQLQALSDSTQRRGAQPEVIETELVPSGGESERNSQRLYVMPHRVAAVDEGEPGWLLTLSAALENGENQNLSEQEESERRLAMLLRVEAEEWIVGRLTHDLNNTFQALSGTLWLMQEQASGALLAPSHLARIEASCRLGIAQVQVQTSLFQRNARQNAGLRETLQACEPALRHLLRGSQRLALRLGPVTADLLVERRPLMNLLLQLGNFVGSQAAPTSAIDVSFGSSMAKSPEGAGLGASEILQLMFGATLPNPLSDEAWFTAMRLPGALWACSKLASVLGAHFAVQVEGCALRLFVLFQTQNFRRQELVPVPGASRSNR